MRCGDDRVESLKPVGELPGRWLCVPANRIRTRGAAAGVSLSERHAEVETDPDDGWDRAADRPRHTTLIIDINQSAR